MYIREIYFQWYLELIRPDSLRIHCALLSKKERLHSRRYFEEDDAIQIVHFKNN